MDLPTDEERGARYAALTERIKLSLEGETDWITAMATVAAMLHGEFEYFDWTGFYRAVEPDLLVLGPFQGGEACFRIPFDKGVCGAAARTRSVILVDDVSTFDGHIACSSTTVSELVSPVVSPKKRLLGVLDIDSNSAAAFTKADEIGISKICQDLGEMYGATTQL